MGVTQGKPMDCVVYEGSRQGRRSTMEDAHRVVRSLGNHPDYAMYGVFDGHNGIGAAKYLESKLPDIIDGQLGAKKAPVNIADVPAALSRAFCQIDAAYIKYCMESGDEAGSTAVIALLNKVTHHLFVANVGDARCVIGNIDGSAEALSIDHKPMLPEERARIEAAGHVVEEMRLDGMLAVSRAIGDIPFKIPRDINLKPEDKALSPVPYVRVKHINVTTDDEHMRVNDQPIASSTSTPTVNDDQKGSAGNNGRYDSDNGISLMSGSGPMSNDSIGSGHGLTHSTMRPAGGTYSSSSQSVATSISTSTIFGLPRTFPDLSVTVSSSSLSMPPVSPIPALPNHFNLATLTPMGNDATTSQQLQSQSLPVMISPSSDQMAYHQSLSSSSIMASSIFSTFGTISLSRALTIPVPQAPSPGAPITFSPNPSRSVSPSLSSMSSSSSLMVNDVVMDASTSSSTHLARSNSAPQPHPHLHHVIATGTGTSTSVMVTGNGASNGADSETLPVNEPRLVTSISLFGRGATAPPPTSFAPRPLFPIATAAPLPFSHMYANQLQSQTQSQSAAAAAAVAATSISPQFQSQSLPTSPVSMSSGSPVRSPPIEPLSPTPLPSFALNAPIPSSSVATSINGPPSPVLSSNQRSTSFVFASPSPARPPRHNQAAPPPLFLRSVSAPNGTQDNTGNNGNGVTSPTDSSSNDESIGSGHPSMLSLLSTSSNNNNNTNDGNTLTSRSLSALNVGMSSTNVITPADNGNNASSSLSSSMSLSSPSDTTVALASPSVAAGYGVSIGGTHRQQLRRPFSLVMSSSASSSSSSSSAAAATDNSRSGATTPDGGGGVTSEFDVTLNGGSGHTLVPSRAYFTPATIATRDAASSVPNILPSHQSSGMAYRQHRSAADIYDGASPLPSSLPLPLRRDTKPRTVVSYRALAKVAPTLQIDPTKSWQFLVIACDGLFDVMTNQQVVDWVNGELRSRARAMRTVVRHHLSICGVPDDQLFDIHHDHDDTNIASLVANNTNGNGNGALSLSSTSLVSVSSTGMTGYGTSINPNTNNTQAEWEELNRRAAAEAKAAKEQANIAAAAAARARSATSIAYGNDEFISLDSLATDLCDLAIRKGSTDNVSVLIVMFEAPPQPTNKKLIQKLQQRAKREMEKDRKRAKEQARIMAKNDKAAAAAAAVSRKSSVASSLSSSSSTSNPTAAPTVPSAAPAAMASVSASASASTSASSTAGIGHGTTAAMPTTGSSSSPSVPTPSPAPLPLPMALTNVNINSNGNGNNRQLMHLGPSGRVDDPELTIFAQRGHKKEPSRHVNTLFKT